MLYMEVCTDTMHEKELLRQSRGLATAVTGSLYLTVIAKDVFMLP